MSGHAIYRNWCPVCIKAYAKDTAHKKSENDPHGLPEYSWDYCFPGDEFGFKWTILVGKEKMSKSVMATAIPDKGGGNRFAVDQCMEFLDENGDHENRVIVKTDQENSIKLLMKELVEEIAREW